MPETVTCDERHEAGLKRDVGPHNALASWLASFHQPCRLNVPVISNAVDTNAVRDLAKEYRKEAAVGWLMLSMWPDLFETEARTPGA